jgi:hypothetical protein
MRRVLAVPFCLSAVLFFSVSSAAADSPFPVGPPNQPVTYGDCISTTAAGEGIEDYLVGLPEFTRLVKPPQSRRPGVEDAFACKGFSPPPGPSGQ